MNIKNLKLKAHEELRITSKDGFAQFWGVNGDTFRFLDTSEIKYDGNPLSVNASAWKRVLPSLEFLDVSEIQKDRDTIYFSEKICVPYFNRDMDFLEKNFELQMVLPADLIPVIKDVGMYVENEGARYFLQGIFFAENGDIVATDAHRLCLKTSPFKFGNWIVRPEAFTLLKGDVTVSKADVVRGDIALQYLKLTDGKNVIYTQCVDGKFPNYERVIPTDMEKSLFVKGFEAFKKNESVYKTLTKSVEISDDGIKSVENEITFGKMSEWFSKNIRFNGEYLRDLFKQFGDAIQVTIQPDCNYSKSEERAVTFGTSDYYSVVMPLRY